MMTTATMGMPPTAEQDEAVRLFQTGDSLAIEAGAGTGKTSTLVLLAEAAGTRRGQYLAFNKALVEDSRGRFPLNTVASNTAHSLAFRALGVRYKHRLDNSARMSGREVAARLGIDPIAVRDFEGAHKVLAPAFLASQVRRTVGKFCQSADPVITARHVPYIDGLDPVIDGKRTYHTNNDVAAELVPYALAMWADLQQLYGWAPYGHDHYLKAWQLSDPRIAADYVMFDEAQDANPVIAAIVAAQDHAQRVYVGDENQAIYEWTGAVNALALTDVMNRTKLQMSFRFGQTIADVANGVLARLPTQLHLLGNPAIQSRLEPLALPRAILTRTNAAAISRLLALQADGRAAHLVGGAADVMGFCRAAQELIAGQRTQYPDLAIFATWPEVQEYVKQDPDGEDLQLMVRLVDEFTPEAIIDGLTKMPPEQRAEVVLSTAHKSKGRQWPTVQLAPDFRKKVTGDDVQPSELRLLYVAVTRAQQVLDHTAILDPEEDK